MIRPDAELELGGPRIGRPQKRSSNIPDGTPGNAELQLGIFPIVSAPPQRNNPAPKAGGPASPDGLRRDKAAFLIPNSS